MASADGPAFRVAGHGTSLQDNGAGRIAGNRGYGGRGEDTMGENTSE